MLLKPTHCTESGVSTRNLAQGVVALCKARAQKNQAEDLRNAQLIMTWLFRLEYAGVKSCIRCSWAFLLVLFVCCRCIGFLGHLPLGSCQARLFSCKPTGGDVTQYGIIWRTGLFMGCWHPFGLFKTGPGTARFRERRGGHGNSRLNLWWMKFRKDVLLYMAWCSPRLFETCDRKTEIAPWISWMMLHAMHLWRMWCTAAAILCKKKVCLHLEGGKKSTKKTKWQKETKKTALESKPFFWSKYH